MKRSNSATFDSDSSRAPKVPRKTHPKLTPCTSQHTLTSSSFPHTSMDSSADLETGDIIDGRRGLRKPGVYLALEDLPVGGGTRAQCMGIVVSVDDIRESKHGLRWCEGELILSIGIIDAGFHRTGSILKINLFVAPDRQDWLPVLPIGSAILLCGIEVHQNDGHRLGVGYFQKFKWAGLETNHASLASFALSSDSPYYPLQRDEREALQVLSNWWKRHERALCPTIKLGLQALCLPFGKIGDKLIKDVQVGDTFHCAVKIERIWPGTAKTPAEIYVTDFTQNLQLQERSAGPIGHRTMKITLWDGAKRNLPGRGFYRLESVRAKLDKQSPPILEGAMCSPNFSALSLDSQDVRGIHRRQADFEQESLPGDFKLSLPESSVSR